MKKSIWHQDYVTLRSELRQMRKQAQLTQVELSIKLEKPQSFIAKYENGDRNLDVIEIIKICKACDHDALEFITELIKKLNEPSST